MEGTFGRPKAAFFGAFGGGLGAEGGRQIPLFQSRCHTLCGDRVTALTRTPFFSPRGGGGADFPRLLGGSPLSECRNGFADASRALQWARPSRDPPWETARLGGSAAAWAAREMPGFPRAGPGGRRKGGGGANLRGAETGGDLGPLAAAGRSPGGTSRGCSAAPLCQNVETVLQTPPGPSNGLDRHAILRGKRPGLEDLRRLGPPGKCRDFPGPGRAGGEKEAGART